MLYVGAIAAAAAAAGEEFLVKQVFPCQVFVSASGPKVQESRVRTFLAYAFLNVQP
jgi:hypothetical protein